MFYNEDLYVLRFPLFLSFFSLSFFLSLDEKKEDFYWAYKTPKLFLLSAIPNQTAS
jgi:hypothetical protein